ncbi:SMI1/KNR4 family protein [Spongiactinospora rosea]|uniref:SMI1/KNR4 family protein n=1 Tax=Spongiactinospora rosea TaxID=2248750 RepID=A0A366LQ95_9ACTN|nr:SMI1/KNR4 family protein [Spongiactinospora rosea]RBQ15810.1 SMI1/KNR4 family protein [Spongiactinospora rosea]
MTAFEVIRRFPAAMADRAGAWDFIRGFAATWRCPLTEGDGWPEANLDAAEARLGLRLPAALREAYRLLGRRTDLTSLQDVLLSPAQLTVEDQALVFRVENQSVSLWGIPVSHLEQPDPPVVVRMETADHAAETWNGWLDRFSHACVEIVLSESLFSCEQLGDNRELADEEAGTLERRFTRLPLPEYSTSQATVPGVRWFAGPDLIIRDDHRAWMWVRARTADALARIRRELPGEWMMDHSY